MSEFPTSKSIDDLEATFAANVKKFTAALTAAGATYTIGATKRPPERGYLMHWAWQIAKGGKSAKDVPAKEGVNIEWWHGDDAKSKAAAQEMCDKYDINDLEVAPSLTSRHFEGKAIDMSVSWSGTLKIATADGKTQEITSEPRDSTNADLIAVGKGYSVIHYTDALKDKPHWSTDGR
ncbi:MAG: peptidoglycan-binding domain-containing protein [Chloroflexi bacterium]|nr:MAG: peptidoglycan-binding domain-containing protein [Chloroflexota bacterium]